jgi:hypothetical protein
MGSKKLKQVSYIVMSKPIDQEYYIFTNLEDLGSDAEGIIGDIDGHQVYEIQRVGTLVKQGAKLVRD